MTNGTCFVFNPNNWARVSGVWGYTSMIVLVTTVILILAVVTKRCPVATKWSIRWLLYIAS